MHEIHTNNHQSTGLSIFIDTNNNKSLELQLKKKLIIYEVEEPEIFGDVTGNKGKS